MSGIMWPVWDYPALCQGREVAHPEPDWDRERGQTLHLTGRGQAGRSWVGLSVQDLVCYRQPLACVSVCVCFSPKLGAPLGLLENCCPHFYHLYCLVLRNVFLLWRPWLSLSPCLSAQAQKGFKYAGWGWGGRGKHVLSTCCLRPHTGVFCIHPPPSGVSPEMEHSVFAGSLLDVPNLVTL